MKIRRYRLLAILVIVLLAVSLSQAFLSSAAGQSRTTRGNTDVNLFLHAGSTLDTQPPDSPVPQTLPMSNGDSETFTIETPLGGPLNVLGKDTGGGKGLWLFLDTLIPSNATLTITVLDGTKEVAKTSLESANAADSPKTIPFLDTGKTNYTFITDISLKLEASVVTLGVGITYDSTASDGHLVLTCDHVSIEADSLKVLNSEGLEASEFTPNHPVQEKLITFEGTVSDILGAADIYRVIIQVFDPANAMVHENLSSKTNETPWDVIYKYDWEYPQGLESGDYTVKAVVQDQSGTNFTTTAGFSFSDYGVYLSTTAAEKNGAIGADVVFDVRVYNTGAQQDTVSISFQTTIGWTVTVDSPSILLAGGEFKNVTVTVSVPDTALPKQEEEIKLRGTSAADTSFDEITLKATAVSSFDFTFEAKGETSATITPGDTKTFLITLKNSGEQSDTYNFFVPSAPPSGWVVALSATGATKVNGSSNHLEYTIPLDAGRSVDIRVEVTVDLEPAVTSTDIVVTATSEKDPFGTQNSVTFAASTIIDWEMYVGFEGGVKKRTAEVLDEGVMSFNAVAFSITITNIEMRPVSVSISLEMDQSSTWNPTIGPNDFVLEEDETRTATLTLRPPPGTRAGTYAFAVGIIEKDTSTPSLDVKLNGQVVIPAIPKFEWKVVNNNLTIEDHGESVEFEVRVFNRGNAPTGRLVFRVEEITDADGVNVTIENNVVDTINMGNNYTFFVKVTADDDAPLKETFKFRIIIDTVEYDSHSETLYVDTDIDPRYISFITSFYWVPIMMIVVIGAAIFLRYRQLS